MDDEHKLALAARVIGDPTRAKMLWSLMGGEARPAGELALIAGVSNQTASNHLAQLRSANLLSLHVRGRSRFYQLRDASVAKALEALMHLAHPKATRATGTAAHVAPRLTHARTCYDHLAGAVAVSIAERMKEKSWLVPKKDDFVLTSSGERYLISFGLEVEVAKASRRRFAYPCLDWSERVDHIGGALGAALLSWLLQRKLLAKVRDTRAMRVTISGRKFLEDAFGLRIALGGNTVTSLPQPI